MAKTKIQKQGTVTNIADRLGRMAGAVFADFSGLKMPEFDELRAKARAVGGEYLVVKKTLFRRAAEKCGVPADVADTSGALSVLFGFDDPIAPAKIVRQFTKTHTALRVVGGLIREALGLRVLEIAEVAALGDLPSREALVARAVGSIAAPLRGLVGVMQGNVRQLVYVLDAIQKAKS